jgi:hypothetical protein
LRRISPSLAAASVPESICTRRARSHSFSKPSSAASSMKSPKAPSDDASGSSAANQGRGSARRLSGSRLPMYA